MKPQLEYWLKEKTAFEAGTLPDVLEVESTRPTGVSRRNSKFLKIRNLGPTMTELDPERILSYYRPAGKTREDWQIVTAHLQRELDTLRGKELIRQQKETAPYVLVKDLASELGILPSSAYLMLKRKGIEIGLVRTAQKGKPRAAIETKYYHLVKESYYNRWIGQQDIEIRQAAIEFRKTNPHKGPKDEHLMT